MFQQGSYDDANYPPPPQANSWSDAAGTDGHYASEQSNASFEKRTPNYDNNDAWSEEWDDGQSDVTAIDNNVSVVLSVARKSDIFLLGFSNSVI